MATMTVYAIVFADNEQELSGDANLFTDQVYAESIAAQRNTDVPGCATRSVKVKPMTVYR
jgi:hypothetical protein